MQKIKLFVFGSLFIIVSVNLFGQQNNIYTLLVGLKNIDDSAYAKISKKYSREATSGVDLDLYKMNRISTRFNHTILTLSDKEATKKKVLDTIISIGKKIKPGDTFLFYFSGHGDIVADRNGDEFSGFDQVLVAYDQFIVDDEIYLLLKKYFTKTKNIMIVDACHSSTSWKWKTVMMDLKLGLTKQTKYLSEQAIENQELLANNCNWDSLKLVDEPFNLVYIGATEDFNVAAGDGSGGLLTYWLDRVFTSAIQNNTWNQYSFRRLACELGKIMYHNRQYLQYHEIGRTVSTYSIQTPFK